MKIFKMNDYDWVAATTAEEATKYYESIVNADPEEEPPVALTVDQLKAHRFLKDTPTDDNEEELAASTWTFADELAERLANNEKFPCFFASTEW